MNLADLTAPPRKRKKRVGRGPGSGVGKTCGRGHKGQKARSGAKIPVWFEGGQMPLKRRIPKRGFKNANFRREVATIDFYRLSRFEAGTEVTPELLRAEGLVKGAHDAIKLLANGELDRALTIRVHLWSKAAEEKVKAAGGTLEAPEAPQPPEAE